MYRELVAEAAADREHHDLPPVAPMTLYLLRSQGGDLGKTGGIGNSEISQHFTIQRNAGFLEAVDESTVGQVVHAGRGIDSDNPQAPEISLTRAAIAIGIHKGLIDGIRRRAEKLAVAAAKPLGQLQHFFSPSSGFEPSFDTHGIFSFNLGSAGGGSIVMHRAHRHDPVDSI